MHHYTHHIGDYRRDTGHLSLLEHGIYRQLLDTYYLDERPIPNSFPSVCRRLSAKSEIEQAAVKAVVKEFFTLLDGEWHHSRCDRVIQGYQHIQKVNSSNGKQGGRGKRKRLESESLANQKATTNHKPITNNQRNTPQPPFGGVEAFDRWYLSYPVNVKRQAAIRAWNKLEPDEALQAAMVKAVSEQVAAGHFDNADGKAVVPYPSAWLSARRWEDQPKPPMTAAGATPEWWANGSKGWLAKGLELGLPAPPEPVSDHPQAFRLFRANVMVAAGDGQWWDDKDSAYPLAVRLRSGGK